MEYFDNEIQKEFLTVKEFADRVGKSEETIKRWIRSGKISNAYKESDKKGWRIPLKDLYLNVTTLNENPNSCENSRNYESNQDDRELINLAYQAVTMTSPTEEILGYLTYIGIKRALEILLVMQQSPTKVKNPSGFIKKAISKGWTPITIPIKKERKISRIQNPNLQEREYERRVPFYNWLEE